MSLSGTLNEFDSASNKLPSDALALVSLKGLSSLGA